MGIGLMAYIPDNAIVRRAYRHGEEATASSITPKPAPK